MRTNFLLCVITALFWSCSPPEPTKAPEPRSGSWRMEMLLSDSDDVRAAVLPFLFELGHDSSGWAMLVHNGEERIAVDDIHVSADSVRIRMPLFDSEFLGRLTSDSVIEGFWCNYLKGPDYRIPFVARASSTDRFPGKKDDHLNLTGTWEAHFSQGTPDAYPAMGLFKTTQGVASGTFCTETGDYRFLEGVTRGDSLLLSCFDGSHAFLFEARLHGDTLRGRYRSGNHWDEPFLAWRNKDFHLRDPDSLTTLREGYRMAELRFPDLHGDTVSLTDARFAGRVVLVQVMGSWCPNCVDETKLLQEMYASYHDQGLDVIALAFERYTDPVKARSALIKFKQDLGIQYDLLYAGDSKKDLASEKLPFLSQVMSYPTCIFIDRSGNVRRIRTGFYGPGTGAHYETYARNLKAYIEKMLAEEVQPARRAA